jgi:hypothetical protein
MKSSKLERRGLAALAIAAPLAFLPADAGAGNAGGIGGADAMGGGPELLVAQRAIGGLHGDAVAEYRCCPTWSFTPTGIARMSWLGGERL